MRPSMAANPESVLSTVTLSEARPAIGAAGISDLARRAADWRTPPTDHITTRYQEKRLGDCEPIWLEFERV